MRQRVIPAQLKVRANYETQKDPSQFSLISDPSSRPCLQRKLTLLLHAKIKTKNNKSKGSEKTYSRFAKNSINDINFPIPK